MKWAKSQEIKVIHLVRNNVLRHRISQMFHHRDTLCPGCSLHAHPNSSMLHFYNMSKVSLNISTIGKILSKQLESRQSVRSLLRQYLPGQYWEVAYEGLTVDIHQCHAMMAFLHPSLALEGCKLQSGTEMAVMHGHKPCRDLVENWDEVKAELIRLIANDKICSTWRKEIRFALDHCEMINPAQFRF